MKKPTQYPQEPPLTLLEFIGCCFEKNELISGRLERHNCYETPEDGARQATVLVEQATALLGEPSHETLTDGCQVWCWPTLQIAYRGTAVVVDVPVRTPEAYYAWETGSQERWERAQRDFKALARLGRER